MKVGGKSSLRDEVGVQYNPDAECTDRTKKLAKKTLIMSGIAIIAGVGTGIAVGRMDKKNQKKSSYPLAIAAGLGAGTVAGQISGAIAGKALGVDTAANDMLNSCTMKAVSSSNNTV